MRSYAPLPVLLAAALSVSAQPRAIEAPTIAEIFIEEGEIRVEAEVEFKQPDTLQTLLVRCGADTRAGRLTGSSERPRVRLDNVTGEVITSQSERALAQVWEYACPGRPRTITISGPRIGFVAYHLGMPVMDIHYLDGEQTLDLDWQDPWNSRFRDGKLRRQYNARLSAYLYIEPYEVRVEVVGRPMDLGEPTAATIPIEAQQGIKDRVAATLAQSFELTVDGQRVTPVLDTVHFLRRRFWTSSVIDPPEVLNARSATLGVVFVAPTTGFPQKAAVTWKRFDPKIQQIAAAATDDAGPRPKTLRPRDNVLVWENLLDRTSPASAEIGRPPGPLASLLPLLGILCAAALVALLIRTAIRVRRGHPLPRNSLLASFALLLVAAGAFTGAPSSTISDAQAGRVLHGLLFNIYRAFDFRDENAVYDLLSRSVSGDLLRDTYLQTRRSLELRNQGGARVRVKQVEIQRVEATALSRGAGFRAKCSWVVSGSVGHWGHVHQRRNLYQGLFTVWAVDGAWKISGMELQSEERLLPELPGA